MRALIDPVKILARRYASLPAHIRLKIAEKLLKQRDENQAVRPSESCCHSCGADSARRKSLLEQFWDEVEEAHNDDLYPVNPFAIERPQPVFYALEDPSSPVQLVS